MRKKEYLDTMKRINKQIAKYLENGFNELNPRQHLFELIGWRNKLTYSINIEEDIKDLRKAEMSINCDMYETGNNFYIRQI